MTKEITINYKGGSRRVELNDPGEQRRVIHMKSAPLPLMMTPDTLAWMNATIVLGTDLSLPAVENLSIPVGLGLIGEIMTYWEKDETAEEQLPYNGDFDLNDDGTVDVGEWR